MFSTYIDFCIGIHFRQTFGWKAICDRGKAYLLWRPSKPADAQCMSSLLGYLEVFTQWCTQVNTFAILYWPLQNSIAIYGTLPNELKLQPYHQQTQNHLPKCFMSNFMHVEICMSHSLQILCTVCTWLICKYCATSSPVQVQLWRGASRSLEHQPNKWGRLHY